VRASAVTRRARRLEFVHIEVPRPMDAQRLSLKTVVRFPTVVGEVDVFATPRIARKRPIALDVQTARSTPRLRGSVLAIHDVIGLRPRPASTLITLGRRNDFGCQPSPNHVLHGHRIFPASRKDCHSRRGVSVTTRKLRRGT
jgi:hypothetical protein